MVSELEVRVLNKSSTTIDRALLSMAKYSLITFNHSLLMKLHIENFLAWKQVMVAIKGHKLQQFVTSQSMPSMFLKP